MMNFDNFFEDAFKGFFSTILGESNDKDKIAKSIDSIRKNYGGEVKTEYEKLIKVSKTWTSDDGSCSRTFTYFISDEENKDTIEIERLQDELQEALAIQDYEKCAIIRDKINAIKKD